MQQAQCWILLLESNKFNIVAATNNNTQTTTAITSAAIIGGIIYGRVKNKSILETFGIAVVFGFVAYVGIMALEENYK